MMLERAMYSLVTTFADMRNDIFMNAFLPIMVEGQFTSRTGNKFKYLTHGASIAQSATNVYSRVTQERR